MPLRLPTHNNFLSSLPVFFSAPKRHNPVYCLFSTLKQHHFMERLFQRCLPLFPSMHGPFLVVSPSLYGMVMFLHASIHQHSPLQCLTRALRNLFRAHSFSPYSISLFSLSNYFRVFSYIYPRTLSSAISHRCALPFHAHCHNFSPFDTLLNIWIPLFFWKEIRVTFWLILKRV